MKENGKKELFEQLRKNSEGVRNIIYDIERIKGTTGIKGNLPNIGITTNNKVIELMHQFENAGTSLFKTEINRVEREYGVSFLGKCIISTIMDYVQDGLQNINLYNQELNQIKEPKQKANDMLNRLGPIKNLYIKMTSGRIVNKLLFSKEETTRLQKHLEDYREADKKIGEYNLKDDLIKSVVTEVRKTPITISQIPIFIDIYIVPELEKLGLMQLLPKLKFELERAILENNKSWKLTEDKKRETQKKQAQIPKKMPIVARKSKQDESIL